MVSHNKRLFHGPLFPVPPQLEAIAVQQQRVAEEHATRLQRLREELDAEQQRQAAELQAQHEAQAQLPQFFY